MSLVRDMNKECQVKKCKTYVEIKCEVNARFQR